MPANPLAASSSVNIVQGSFDYFYLEERLATGAPLAVPYTPAVQKFAILGSIILDVKDDAASVADVKVKTPAFGRDYTASHAADVSSGASAAPLPVTVTLLIKETDGAHIASLALLKGKYYNLILPLGVRGAKTTDIGLFVKFDISTQIKFEDNKESDFTLKATVQNNTVSDTCTLPTDGNIHATAIVIGVNAGFLIVETA